jgi:hypothetical protein
MLFEVGDVGYVIVEVDENQHKDYPKHQERQRMKAIQTSLGKPCVFIRYNPDSYSSLDGKRKYPRFETRYNKLKTTILREMTKLESGDALLQIVYLFYDEGIYDEEVDESSEASQSSEEDEDTN